MRTCFTEKTHKLDLLVSSLARLLAWPRAVCNLFHWLQAFSLKPIVQEREAAPHQQTRPPQLLNTPSCKMYSTCCPVLAKATRACHAGSSDKDTKTLRQDTSAKRFKNWAFSTSRPLAKPCASWPVSTSLRVKVRCLYSQPHCRLICESVATSYLRIETCKDRSRPIFGMSWG